LNSQKLEDAFNNSADKVTGLSPNEIKTQLGQGWKGTTAHISAHLTQMRNKLKQAAAESGQQIRSFKGCGTKLTKIEDLEADYKQDLEALALAHPR